MPFAVRRPASSDVELAGIVELMQFVAAADMHAADENLRHGIARRWRARSSSRAARGRRDVDLGEGDALAVQQGLGGVAIGAKWVV